MKKFVKLFNRPLLRALCAIAFVAVMGFSMAGCSDNSGGGSTPLNGDWTDRSKTYVITISGSSGRFSRIYSSSEWYAVQNRGHVDIGSQWIRNIRRTGDSSYSAEKLIYDDTNNYRTSWTACTITLASNGQTFYLYAPGQTRPSGTYDRW
jgi:hypothetical protein